MSNINTVYDYFETYNYSGTLNTSSYALPFAKFTFKPRLDSATSALYSVKRILWDFGDGTITEAVTASHAYSKPGKYKVSSTLYDGSGNSYFNTFYQVVDVYDFVPTDISIDVLDTQSYILTAGRINNSLLITNSLPYYILSGISDNKTIIAYCSGSNSDYFSTGLVHTPYGYLYPYTSFYTLETGLNNLTEFVEVSSFKTITVPYYCKLSSNAIVYTDSTDADAFFCGVTGSKTVYFKSDKPISRVNLMFGYEQGVILKNTNTSTVGVCAQVISNNDYNTLSINSNGITSEGETSDLFPISKNKFSNTKVGFVVKVKDSLNFTNKTFPTNDVVRFSLTNGLTTFNNVQFYTNYNELSTLTYGAIKGYFIADLPYTSNVYISAVFVNTNISGTSNTFNVYPKDYYTIAKRGEDIDMTQQYKDIAFQPLFLDNPVLFDNFLNSIVGDLSSRIGVSLGKRPYEKIDNFVDNNASVDFSGVQSLVSINDMVGNTDVRFDRSNYLYPTEIGRLIDLCSINFSRLRGASDIYDQDYNTYGYQSRETYGKNLGKEVTINYTITAGVNLVAFEKYSGKFTFLNTYFPLINYYPTVTYTQPDGFAYLQPSGLGNYSSPNIITYPLSSYNETWGWGLALPSNVTPDTIGAFYLFYEHAPTLSGVITNGIINYSDVTNTISQNITSYTEWSQPDGIIANLLSNQLYTGLDLFQ